MRRGGKAASWERHPACQRYWAREVEDTDVSCTRTCTPSRAAKNRHNMIPLAAKNKMPPLNDTTYRNEEHAKVIIAVEYNLILTDRCVMEPSGKLI